jgi:hypothetical protein
MRKLAAIALGTIVALGLAAPAHAAPQRHRYVAHDSHFGVLAFVSGWTGIALEGTVSFVPTRDRATVTIDDVLADGTVPVIVSTVDGVRRECVAVGSKVTLGGLVPNRRTYLYVLDTTFKGRCTMGATAGVISLL